MQLIKTRSLLLALSALLAGAGVQAADSGAVPAPAFAGQTRAPQPGHQVAVEVIASGLQLPRSLVALPDGGFIVTEGIGTVRVLRPDGQLSLPLAGMPPVRSVDGKSLEDFVLAHDFDETRTVYFTYSAPPAGEPGGPVTAAERSAALAAGKVFQVGQVARARLAEDYTRLEDVEVIAEITGRRLVSAPDDTLYISTMSFEDDTTNVQKLTTLEGKVLRINGDGSIPADNPYHGRSLLRQEIFSYGHLDPDGLALDPETGKLWLVEHGPTGGDELNLLGAGKNYGWPLVTYGKAADGSTIAPAARSGLEQPLYYWYPSIAPSGLMVYRGDEFPQWRGNLFIGALSAANGRFLVRLVLEDDRVIAEEHLLTDSPRRVRDVAQGADGAIYVLADSESTERYVTGEVLRLTARGGR